MRYRSVLVVSAILMIATTLEAQVVRQPPTPWREAGPAPGIGSDGSVLQCAPAARIVAAIRNNMAQTDAK